MKIVLVKEQGTVRILEGKGKVDGNALALRSKFAGGDLKYYELDYEEREGCPLEGYIVVLNEHPNLLNTSKMIREL